MKRIFEYLGITFLFIISLIYTENITNIVKENDPIMKSLKNKQQDYLIESVNATIDDEYIMPGINGCTIDINKSYNDMKKINSYTEKMIKYKDLIPEISINNIYDKYIKSGNSKNRNVSIVVYIKKDINKINEIINTKLNVFLDSNILMNGKVDITENKKIYNGGNNKNYDDVTIEWVNDVIMDNYNYPKYCLNIDKNDNNLLSCSKAKMHTISPNIIVNKNDLYNIKSSITSGSIIYFDENNIDKIKEISDFITNKGYNIVYLNDLLSEDNCN